MDIIRDPPDPPAIVPSAGDSAGLGTSGSDDMNMMTPVQARAAGATISTAIPAEQAADGANPFTAPLPLHCATYDEPIPSLGKRPWDGPNMRKATPIEQMLEILHGYDDDDASYLALWRCCLKEIGCSVLISFERDGTRGLMHGGPCDSQMRHRSRWMHFLLEDLDRVEARRELLLKQLAQSGHRCDKRPRDPRRVKSAIRAFIAAGGRLLLTPEGYIEDSYIFRNFADVLAAQREHALAEYLAVREGLQSDRLIKRAVRKLGTRTNNGWIVLERKER